MPKLSKRASLLKEYEAVSKSRAVKAYNFFCLDEEDRIDDHIEDKRHSQVYAYMLEICSNSN